MSEIKTMTLENSRDLRAEMQETIDEMNTRARTRSLSLSLAITKLEESKMWLGKHMWEIGWEDLNKKRDEELKNK